MCEKYSHVRVFEKGGFAYYRSYNSRKLLWINKALLLVGVLGGSSYPCAYFNKDARILHKRSRKAEYSHQLGFYRYLSDPPLQLKVVDSDQVFKCAPDAEGPRAPHLALNSKG